MGAPRSSDARTMRPTDPMARTEQQAARPRPRAVATLQQPGCTTPAEKNAPPLTGPRLPPVDLSTHSRTAWNRPCSGRQSPTGRRRAMCSTSLATSGGRPRWAAPATRWCRPQPWTSWPPTACGSPSTTPKPSSAGRLGHVRQQCFRHCVPHSVADAAPPQARTLGSIR